MWKACVSLTVGPPPPAPTIVATPSGRCAVLLAVLMAVAGVACRNAVIDAIQEPPHPFALLDIPFPVRWIESPESAGVVREYYEGVLRRVPKVASPHVNLVVTQEGQPPSSTYELAEYRFGPGHTLIGTTKSAGKLTTNFVKGAQGQMLLAYYFDGGASPGKALALVRFADRLHTADPADIAHTDPVRSPGLIHTATATKGRVEIGDWAGIIYNWKVRLRPGEQLVVRLHVEDGWSMKRGTTGLQLRLESSSPERVSQVFRFRAVEPGWTDLSFATRSGQYTVRVKVE